MRNTNLSYFISAALGVAFIATLVLASCSDDKLPSEPQPDPERPSLADARFSLMCGIGSPNVMWYVDGGNRTGTRAADVPDKLELKGKLHFFANADGNLAGGEEGIPTIDNHVFEHNDYPGAPWYSADLTTNFSSYARSATFYCRYYAHVTDREAKYNPEHTNRYEFFVYNIDDSYKSYTDADGVGFDFTSYFTSVEPANVQEHITEDAPLRWGGAGMPRISPFCAWMYSDVVRSRELGSELVERGDGVIYDGNIILKPSSGNAYNVYVPFIMHPAMALLRVNFKLSYVYATLPGGALYTDEGFREFRITKAVLKDFPTVGENLSLPVAKVAVDKDYASLRSDASDGKFTEVASVYAAPTSSALTVPLTITYDVCDRKGNLIRKGETVDATFTFAHTLESGKYYDVNISIVPSFLYTMSDIDPDSPHGYVVVK